MTSSSVVELAGAVPGTRQFSTRRPVRLGDVSPGGRMRLDALVRYLQDVSDDDTRDAGLDDPGWVVRRTVVRVEQFPRYQDTVTLTTWCSGIGPRWAERRVSLGSSGGVAGRSSRVEAAVLWVHVDPVTMRPAPLTATFHQVFAAASGGRAVSSRLLLDAAPGDGERNLWPLRFTDFDALRHVNNAAVWEVIEEALSTRRHLRAPLTAIVEHRAEIRQDDQVEMVAVDRDLGVDLWLVLPDGRTAVAARVQTGT